MRAGSDAIKGNLQNLARGPHYGISRWQRNAGTEGMKLPAVWSWSLLTHYEAFRPHYGLLPRWEFQKLSRSSPGISAKV